MDIIITPTYNERNNIRTLVEKIFSLYPTIHILVVDDNSPDGTAEVVKNLQSKYPNLHLKQRPSKLGLASAYLESFKEVLEKFHDVRNIITMDADLSHDPEVIKEMLKEMEKYDLVIGSRYVKGGGLSNWELKRRLLSKFGNIYVYLVTGTNIRDLTAGFNSYSAELLRLYKLDSVKATGFSFQMEMKIIAERELKAKIKEVPIIFTRRTSGESKISNRIVYEGLIFPWRFSPILSLFKKRKS